jgi:hypothetical protein
MDLVRTALLAGSALLLLGAAPDDTRNALPSTPPRMHRPAAGVLFSDDFSRDSLGHWSPDRDGVWSIRRGMLRADLPDQKQLRSLIHTGDTSWADIAVDLDVCMMRGVDKGVVVRVAGDAGTGVDLRGGSYQDVVMYQREWPMGRSRAMNANGTWNHLRVEARGNRYRVFVNGELKLDRLDSRSARNIRRSGAIALPAYTGGVGQCTVWYDNVVVTQIAEAAAEARTESGR